MSRYELVKAVHVLAAVVWVGGALAVQWYERRLHRRSPGDVARHLADAEFFGTRVFVPASVAVLASGLGLAAERDWRFEPFMVAGLAVWALAFVTGAAFLGPQAARIRREVAAGATAATARRLRRFRAVSAVEDYLLAAVVVVMVVRPG